MVNQIQSSTEGASELGAEVQKSLAGYLRFQLHSIASLAPVTGGSDHDGLSSGITSALTRWKELIEADANAITSIASELDDQDESISKALLGVGGGST